VAKRLEGTVAVVTRRRDRLETRPSASGERARRW